MTAALSYALTMRCAADALCSPHYQRIALVALHGLNRVDLETYTAWHRGQPSLVDVVGFVPRRERVRN